MNINIYYLNILKENELCTVLIDNYQEISKLRGINLLNDELINNLSNINFYFQLNKYNLHEYTQDVSNVLTQYFTSGALGIYLSNKVNVLNNVSVLTTLLYRWLSCDNKHGDRIWKFLTITSVPGLNTTPSSTNIMNSLLSLFEDNHIRYTNIINMFYSLPITTNAPTTVRPFICSSKGIFKLLMH